MSYLDCEDKELLKVITKDELNFVLNLPASLGNPPDPEIWYRMNAIGKKIVQAIESGKIKQIHKPEIRPSRAKFYVQSDYVPNGGIKSMADGRTYDSKSRYYKSLKEKGLVIVDEKPKEKSRTIESDLTGRDIKNAIERIKSR